MSEVRLQINFRSFLLVVNRAAGNNMKNLARAYIKEMKDRMRMDPKTGKVYKNLKGKAVHQASAPGEAPAILSKSLYKGFQWRHHVMGFLKHYVQVTNTAPYAPMLELGGINAKGHYVAPRPMWFPALLRMKSEFRRHWKDIVTARA